MNHPEICSKHKFNDTTPEQNMGSIDKHNYETFAI